MGPAGDLLQVPGQWKAACFGLPRTYVVGLVVPVLQSDSQKTCVGKSLLSGLCNRSLSEREFSFKENTQIYIDHTVEHFFLSFFLYFLLAMAASYEAKKYMLVIMVFA